MKIRKNGMLRVNVGDGERFFAGAQPALVDFIGVRRAPIVRRRDFDVIGYFRSGCHAPMIPGGRAESTRSCCQLFTGSSPVVGKTASGRFLCEPDRKGNSRSLAAIQPPSFDFNAGFSRIARGFHACKGNSVGQVPGISRIHCLARVLLACFQPLVRTP